MTDLEKNIRNLFSFNSEVSKNKEDQLMNNINEINKNDDRKFFEKIGFVEKVDLSNLTPMERSRKENVHAITLNNGEIKTIDQMFNALIKPSQINYIAEPQDKNSSKFVKIGGMNVQFDLTKGGLNTIIDGATKYVDTINHDKMVSSVNALYKNYLDYNNIIPKNNLLSINKLHNEIGNLEKVQNQSILELNKAYNDYYKREEAVNKNLLEIENLMVKHIEKMGNDDKSMNLINNLNKIKDIKDGIFDRREMLNSSTTKLTKEEKGVLTSEVNALRKEMNQLLKLMPKDITNKLNIYDNNVAQLEKSLKVLEKAEMSIMDINDKIHGKIETIKRLNNSPDKDDYTKSGVVPTIISNTQIEEKRERYKSEFKDSVERKASVIKVSNVGIPIPGLSEEQYLEFKKTIGFFESTHDHTKMNGNGYIGRYQMGVEALVDTGYIKEEYFKKFKSEGGVVGNDWQKKFLDKYGDKAWTIKGGLKTFLNNSNLQDEAMDKNVAFNYKALTSKLKDQGKDIEDITAAELPGLLASAHLIGAGGTSMFIKNGREKEDGNGTKNTTYLVIVTENIINNTSDGAKLVAKSEQQVKEKLNMDIKTSALNSNDIVAYQSTRNIEDIYKNENRLKEFNNNLENTRTL